MSSTPSVPAIRIVPGAPPPAPVSKSQKKKRKAGGERKSADQPDEHVAVPDTLTAALIDHAPPEADLQEGTVAPELITRQSSLAPVSPGGVDDAKLSHLVDMLNKRMKATNKKIVSIQLPHSSF